MPKTVLAAPAVLKQSTNWQSCEQPKFSTTVLVVKTKDIVLASQAVLILFVKSQKISTAVHSKKYAQLVKAKQMFLLLKLC